MEASKHAKNRVAITVVFALTLTSASAGKLFRFVVIFAGKRCRQHPSRSVPLLSLKLFFQLMKDFKIYYVPWVMYKFFSRLLRKFVFVYNVTLIEFVSEPCI